ncbi:MAG: helix-hairpin-helix domain-containing protein [Anaerovoracaceae bacterium]|jgi:competence protein ComEA|nr:helix-hairpin-helix domain-containing protein [Anaerovoracaceae bacterium]
MEANIARILEILKKNPQWIKAAVIALVIIVAFLFTLSGGDDEDGISIETHGSKGDISQSMEDLERVAQEKHTIIVDVGGAVNKPGVVELPEGSRVYQAIEKAGGVSRDGDLAQVNQAIILNDCDKLYIPTFQEMDQATISSNKPSGLGLVSSESTSNGKININTASKEELETLNGIGPVTANKIIDYRTSNGPFHAIENIMEVPGIGEKTFAGMKDCLCI